MLTTRSLILICSATLLWAFSFGLGSQVVTHRLNDQDVSDTIIGLSHAFYYLGLAVASCLVPFMTRRLGTARCAAVGMIGAGATLIAFPFGADEVSWCLLRFLNGCAGAMSLVPLETLVSRDSPSDKKTQHFAYYGVSLTVGGALGIGLGLHWHQPGEIVAFYLGGAPALAAGGMLAILLRPRELAEQQGPAFALNWRANYLSFATAWWQGFLEGGMLVFLSLFLVSRGFSVDFAGVLMGVVMIGVIVFQVPVSWLADRWGNTPVLLACYGIVGFGLMGIPWLAGPIALAAALFVFGACTGAMYPLGLARLSGNVPAGSLTRAYAWYLAIECIGSLGGAAVMGRARDIWGESAMFGVGLAALLLVLLGWAVLGWPRRKFAESNRANRGVSNRAPAESVI